MKINNIDDLRSHAINLLDALERGDVSPMQAAVASKIYDNIISSVKIQLEYNKSTERDLSVPFLEPPLLLPHIIDESKKAIAVIKKKPLDPKLSSWESLI